MHFVVNRDRLNEGIKWISGIVGKKMMNPALSNIFMILEDNKLELKGTDLDIYISYSLEVDGSEDGAIGILGDRFSSLLAEIPSKDVEFMKREQRGEIKVGNGKYYIAGIDEGDFPSFDLLQGESKSFSIKGRLLARLLEKTRFSISTDMTRINLSALLFNIEKGKVTTVATDGHKLALFKYEDNELDLPDLELLIPRKTVEFISKLASKYNDEEVNIIIGEKNIKFETDGISIISHLVSKKFPNYNQVLPKNNDKTLRINKEVLSNTLNRMNILASPLTHLIKFHLSSDSIEMYSADIDVGGEAKDKIAAEYSGEEMNIGFNGICLNEILKRIESDDIEISIGQQLTATIIKPTEQKEGEEYITLLMPLRLPDEE